MPVIIQPYEKIVLYSFLGLFLVAMVIFLANELSALEANYKQGAALAEVDL
jgi:hypothetical protein